MRQSEQLRQKLLDGWGVARGRKPGLQDVDAAVEDAMIHQPLQKHGELSKLLNTGGKHSQQRQKVDDQLLQRQLPRFNRLLMAQTGRSPVVAGGGGGGLQLKSHCSKLRRRPGNHRNARAAKNALRLAARRHVEVKQSNQHQLDEGLTLIVRQTGVLEPRKDVAIQSRVEPHAIAQLLHHITTVGHASDGQLHPVDHAHAELLDRSQRVHVEQIIQLVVAIEDRLAVLLPQHMQPKELAQLAHIGVEASRMQVTCTQNKNQRELNDREKSNILHAINVRSTVLANSRSGCG